MDKAGLLPVGVVDVAGSFAQQEAVRIVVVKRIRKLKLERPLLSSTTTSPPSSHQIIAVVDTTIAPKIIDDTTPYSNTDLYEKVNPPPTEVGRALVNYAASEITRIKGLRSTEIEGALGYADSEYVALRENISLFKAGGKGGSGSGSATPKGAE